AIAGGDWRDPQWVRADPRPGEYVSARDESVTGLRVGLLTESADPEICDEAVLANFHAAADALREQGADVGEVSIPLWRDGLAMFLPYIGHLFADTWRAEGQGTGHIGA